MAIVLKLIFLFIRIATLEIAGILVKVMNNRMEIY